MAKQAFVPKPGQVDYTNIRYCPTINCVVAYGNKILILHRSTDLDFYPNYWDGVAGFLDDHQSVEDKVREELLEELYIDASQIASMKHGAVIVTEAVHYKKTWIVFPVLVTIKTDKFQLDYESQDAKWVTPSQAKKLKLVPGYSEILDQFFRS